MEIENKLIIAKLMDKINLCKTRKRVVNTEFLSNYQKNIIKKELNKNKIKNYLFFRWIWGSRRGEPYNISRKDRKKYIRKKYKKYNKRDKNRTT